MLPNVIAKQFGSELIPTSIVGVACPDGRTRNVFISGTPRMTAQTSELPGRVNVRGKSVMGCARLQGGNTWVFEPDPKTSNLHMLNKHHIWSEIEVGVIYPAEQTVYHGEKICKLAIENGWDYTGDGVDPSDMEFGTRYYGEAWVFAEDYLNNRCALKGYEFRTDSAGNWGYWRED